MLDGDNMTLLLDYHHHAESSTETELCVRVRGPPHEGQTTLSQQSYSVGPLGPTVFTTF